MEGIAYLSASLRTINLVWVLGPFEPEGYIHTSPKDER